MNKNNSYLRTALAVVILLIPMGYAFYLYDSLPESIPTHFGINGEPDAYGDRDSIYLGPAILGGVGLLVFLLINNLQVIDPKRYQNADSSIFGKLAFFMVIFMSALGTFIVHASAHPGAKVINNMFPLLGILFAVMGYFMPKIKPNYFVGLRLPWTLSSDENWEATHKIAGKWWLYGGIAQAVLGFILPTKYALIVFFIITAIIVAVPSVFSYRMFKREE